MSSNAQDTDPSSSDAVLPESKHEPTLNDRFFRHFQLEITGSYNMPYFLTDLPVLTSNGMHDLTMNLALQEQMDNLVLTPMVSGEWTDAVDHCLAGIARLSNEVKDASNYIPTYDQRIYGEAIKALQDKLAATRASIAPRQKFSFKSSRKNPSAISLTDVAELAAQSRRHIPGYRSNENSSAGTSANPTPIYPGTPREGSTSAPEKSVNVASTETEPSEEGSGADVQLRIPGKKPAAPSSEAAISINSYAGVHIVLPTSASHANVPASITSIRHCAIDMSVPTANGQPFAGLLLKNISSSLLICGQVNGAAHITGVESSVIVVSCHQFRMHDCKNVDVYLSCSSKPIIEDCSGIRFSNIPPSFKALDGERHAAAVDRWNEVQDFKWLKSEPSPNWKILSESDVIPDTVWVKITSSEISQSLDDILRAARVMAT